MSTTPTIVKIESQAQAYALARQRLSELVSALRAGQEALAKEVMPEIKRALSRAADAQLKLQALVTETPDLFTKPKTRIFHNIRVGYAKGKGKIEFDDAEKVIKLIRRNLPDQAELLIKTTEVPVKDALASLPATDLKKLGVELTGTEDVVVIKPLDSEVDKLVKAVLDDLNDPEFEGQ